MSRENKIKIAVFFLALLLVVILIWRASFDRVGDILKFLPRFEGKEVYLLGRVHSALAVPFIGSVYKISDGSGEIWVLSKIDTARNVQLLFVKGTVKETLDIKNIDLSRYVKTDLSLTENLGPVILEKERRGFLSSLAMVWERRD